MLYYDAKVVTIDIVVITHVPAIFSKPFGIKRLLRTINFSVCTLVRVFKSKMGTL